MNKSNQKQLRLVVLASGRGSNFQAIIDGINSKELESQIVGLICNKEDAQALDRAREHNIPSIVVPSKGVSKSEFNKSLLNETQKLNPDLIILAGFMRILPPEFINQFVGRIINIHPSLLPNFPGLNAQQQAIDSGASETGCTVHFVDEGCDTGPIILQTKTEIHLNESAEELSQRLLPLEHQTLIKCIQLIESNKVVLQGQKTLLRGIS